MKLTKDPMVVLEPLTNLAGSLIARFQEFTYPLVSLSAGIGTIYWEIDGWELSVQINRASYSPTGINFRVCNSPANSAAHELEVFYLDAATALLSSYLRGMVKTQKIIQRS